MRPARSEADPSGGVSDIREILRPAAIPRMPGGEFDIDSPLDIAVEDAVLEEARELKTNGQARFLLVTEGPVEVAFDNAQVLVASREAMWIAPASDGCLSPAGKARVCIVSCRWGSFFPDHREPVPDSAGRLREITQWLTMELRAEFDGANEYRAGLVRLLGGEWLRLNSDDTCVLEKRLRAYVLQHIDEAISLDSVAHHVGVGRYHLCRKYRRTTGQSPMHAVRQFRLERARELLATTKLPLRLVAKRVGLGSEQHLSRLLRLHFGVGARGIRRRAEQ